MGRGASAVSFQTNQREHPEVWPHGDKHWIRQKTSSILSREDRFLVSSLNLWGNQCPAPAF